MSLVQLTPEQQAIVNHNQGAARVFAVAGAGKTTAMTHRIHRLVQEQVFVPQRILASSFSRETVASLQKNLRQWAICQTVTTRTLHSLGYQVIRQAWLRGYLKQPETPLSPEQVDLQLYHQAIQAARSQNLPCKGELENLDQEDFLAYVSSCKAKLHYAEFDRVLFPAHAPHRTIAQPATPPSAELSWYLDLYRLFEAIRDRHGWIGFDDMLMTGWQLLVQYPDLRHDFQRQFDCVIVDEFQDVNRAQFGMLDLLIRPHGNYMVIGDDDQTIYEWRGAEVRFILQEFDRYNPTDYQITDNFRCKATQITLANAVIRHNQNRRKKQLSLTQGFDGCTQIHLELDAEQQGKRVVDQVKASLAAGKAPTEIAILVRVYAQTPYIEQYLIQADIPYWGAKLVPFYRRPEILNFLAFAQLAQLEHLSSHQSQSDQIQSDRRQTDRQQWEAAWQRVKLIPPLRYLNSDLKAQLQNRVLFDRVSFSQALLSVAAEIPEHSARVITALAQWFRVAVQHTSSNQQQSGKTALAQLDLCIGYREHLKRRSGFQETGAGKAAGVEAIISYANHKGSLFAFLDHLDRLQKQAEQQAQTLDRCVCLTTIHQAKGLEWPVVMVPHCNDGTIPFGENLSDAELEAERRLFYVAITRTQQELHLYSLQPLCQFLREAEAVKTIKRTEQVRQRLQIDRQTWQARDVADLVCSIAALGLERYVAQWWPVDPQLKAEIAITIQQCFIAAKQHQIQSLLGLKDNQIEFWQTIAPLQADSLDFPGLDYFLKLSQSPRSAQNDLTQPAQNLLGKLKRYDRVQHKQFGQGTVVAVEMGTKPEAIISIEFQKHGRKRILITQNSCPLQLIHN